MIIILIEDNYTHIHTLNKGTILLKDLQIGDLVYTQNLNYQPVVNITKQKYKNNIYTLYLQNALPLNITEDQEILTIPLYVKKHYNQYPISKFYQTYTKENYNNATRYARDFDLFWLKANQLQNKDCPVTPISFNYQEQPVIDTIFNIPINREFLIFLGYVYTFAEIEDKKCIFFVHKAFSGIKSWIRKYIKNTFNINLTLNTTVMFSKLSTTNKDFVSMIQDFFNNGLLFSIKNLPPKEQLYIFKGLFSTQRNTPSLTINTNNLTLLYNLLEILQRNYFNPDITIVKEQYRILIRRNNYLDFNAFLFQNEKNDKLYKTSITNFTGIQFPILYNDIYYMNYPLRIYKIYQPDEPVTAIKIDIQNNIPIKINSILLK